MVQEGSVSKKVALVATLFLTAGALTLGAAAPPRSQKEIKAKGALKAKGAKAHAKAVRAKDAPHVVGTVTYDTGAANAGGWPGPQNNVGNRFDSAAGGPLLMTGQVSMVTFFPVQAGGTGFVTLFGPPNGGGSASNLGSIQVSGPIANTFNIVNVGNIAVGPDFLAGAWQLLPGTLVNGMDNMSVGGQGFHAFGCNTNFPGACTGFVTVPGQNALVRSTGNILVPVELMNFQVQ
jgi:hypothetical protein